MLGKDNLAKITRRANMIKNYLYNFIDTPVVVLLYHRVADLEMDSQKLAVSPKNFEDQISFLKSNYNILRFEEEWKNIDSPSVVITFDDGYVDNYENALPILEKYNVPATIFVSTGNMNTSKDFWWDALERILLRNAYLPDNLMLMIADKPIMFNLTCYDNVMDCYEKLHPILKNMQAEEREIILKKMQTDLNAEMQVQNFNRTVCEQELKILGNNPWITIGAHTVSHTKLSVQNIEVQKEEIVNSKDYIEHILNKKITVFSYPFGSKSDYTKETVQILNECGFRKVASNYPGQVRNSTNKFEIPRNLVRNWDLDTFKKNLKRFWYI